MASAEQRAARQIQQDNPGLSYTAALRQARQDHAQQKLETLIEMAQYHAVTLKHPATEQDVASVRKWIVEKLLPALEGMRA